MSEIKLKPCPFCGGKPYLETNHRAFINAKTTKVAYVWCRNCNARTERIPLEKYKFDMMLSIYNRRKSGEQVSQDAGAITHNQVYWYGIFADMGI